MPSEIRLSAAIPCGDDQLSQAKILVELDNERAALEAAIKKITGHDVRIEMRSVRQKVKGND